MKLCLIIFFYFSCNILAQSDWVKWKKIDVDFQIHGNVFEASDSLQSSSILSFAKFGYSFLISDLDGDNCPFYPTCSSFYVKSINRTNIFKGTLMFADRFTRDSNLFKSKAHYPKHFHGKLYDPIENYLLIDSTIVFIKDGEL